MSMHDWIDELIGFLLERLDDDGVAVLEAHLPTRVPVEWCKPVQGPRVTMVWGCEACWQKPEEYRRTPGDRWPCATLRALARPFAQDRDYAGIWWIPDHPDHADFWYG
ncbi:hypothetical protein [Streptomyces chattanoogensis]|uniref:hypothetical protein n=1 Tax=Streptomyces chattanoogensis TaxID=66876 RepID=UPI0036C8422E